MRNHDAAGLTLVEVVVVVAIVGVLATAVLLSIGVVGQDTNVEVEAQRLARMVRLAADEALVTDRNLKVSWDKRGYGFESWSDEAARWVPYPVEFLGTRHELPVSITLQGEADAGAASIGPDALPEALVLSFASRAGTWRVVFDGLNVVTASGPGDRP